MNANQKRKKNKHMTKITPDYRLAALRRGIAIKPVKNHSTPSNLLYAASIELANLGFIVKPDTLEGMSADALNTLIADARTVMGTDRDMTPIYPGFPEQVESLDTLTLLFEQILHYWTFGAFLPNYPTVAREGLPIEDMLRTTRELKVVSGATAAQSIMEKLVTDGVGMSDDDKNLLKGSIEVYHPKLQDVSRIVKLSKHGENIQTFVKLVHEVTNLTSEELAHTVIPLSINSDHVLRSVLVLYSKESDARWANNYKLAVETLSDSNARAVRMLKIPRSVRRLVIKRLGEVTDDFRVDRVVSRKNLWRGVMRTVHPYDFTLSVEDKRVADIIHDNVIYRTFNSLVEDGIQKRELKAVVKLLSENQPGNLLRRVVELLRITETKSDAEALANALRWSAVNANLTTLISAYNGILSANDDSERVNRVAGLKNTMIDRSSVAKVDEKHLALVIKSVKSAIEEVLKTKAAPSGVVNVKSDVPVPLVRRDAATTDRVLDRGQAFGLVGDGDVLRIFGHWNNNQRSGGYMDIGVVICDADFEHLANSTWNTWSDARSWSTYSGDKHVSPGDSAPEFIDVKKAPLMKLHPNAKWAVMTVQSWSGWPIKDVDFIAGAMLRSKPQKGEVFDPRSVATAFKPTTESTQAVPFAVNLETGEMVWVDSSNGSSASGSSSSHDSSIGKIVYDEIARPRLTMGDLAKLWAKAHGAKTVSKDVDRDEILELLK